MSFFFLCLRFQTSATNLIFSLKHTVKKNLNKLLIYAIKLGFLIFRTLIIISIQGFGSNLCIRTRIRLFGSGSAILLYCIQVPVGTGTQFFHNKFFKWAAEFIVQYIGTVLILLGSPVRKTIFFCFISVADRHHMRTRDPNFHFMHCRSGSGI